LFIATDY